MSMTETQALAAGTWAVDPVHSTVGFAVGYLAGTFTGTFSEFDAIVTDGVLTGSAKVASVQSPEFFDVERHPELSFESNSIERDGSRTRISRPTSRFGLTLRALIHATSSG